MADIRATRKKGETKFELFENMSLWKQRIKKRQLRFSSLHITKNERGQAMLLVEFDNGKIWMPKWNDEVHFIWCYAFLTELDNWLTREKDIQKPQRYDPEKQLLKPLIDFLNEEVSVWKVELSNSPISQSTDVIGSK